MNHIEGIVSVPASSRRLAMRARLRPAQSLDVLVADNHQMMRDGIIMHLEECVSDLVVTEARDYHEALTLLEAGGHFDVIICEAKMPGPPWRTGLRQLRAMAPLTPLVVISSNDAPEDVREIAQMGVTAFVPKTASSLTLLHAVQLALSGQRYLPQLPPCAPNPKLMGDQNAGWPGRLTRRQQQVLSMMALGLSNKAIAREMNLGEGTVKIHVTAVIRALGARNRVQAVMAARENGLL